MPEVPCYAIEEGIQMFRDIGILKQIFHGRTVYLPWEGRQDMPFTTMRNKFVKGDPRL